MEVVLKEKQRISGIKEAQTPLKEDPPKHLLNDKIPILSWNCRGMGNRNKLNIIRSLIKSEKPHLLLLQETKKKDSEVLQQLDFIWKNTKGMPISSCGT
jgi:hypothetical protein